VGQPGTDVAAPARHVARVVQDRTRVARRRHGSGSSYRDRATSSEAVVPTNPRSSRRPSTNDGQDDEPILTNGAGTATLSRASARPRSDRSLNPATTHRLMQDASAAGAGWSPQAMHPIAAPTDIDVGVAGRDVRRAQLCIRLEALNQFSPGQLRQPNDRTAPPTPASGSPVLDATECLVGRRSGGPTAHRTPHHAVRERRSGYQRPSPGRRLGAR
jgi:hypothetical protein